MSHWKMTYTLRRNHLVGKERRDLLTGHSVDILGKHNVNSRYLTSKLGVGAKPNLSIRIRIVLMTRWSGIHTYYR